MRSLKETQLLILAYGQDKGVPQILEPIQNKGFFESLNWAIDSLIFDTR
jgi:hypothetical protein